MANLFWVKWIYKVDNLILSGLKYYKFKLSLQLGDNYILYKDI